MPQAYILIQVMPGKSSSVVAALKKLPPTKKAVPVAGPCDVVVDVQAKSMGELNDFVLNRVQKIPGILKTVTLLAME